ncbi:MAG TPA: DUF6481 family protein [Methylobacterium sp.]|uniref:DUF6481 family protein n=1 Tax=Methylorubrum sp. B1-46 TaxID=2897334 RepID=UPI001E6090B2|nr:DUF6481 family protein [Methylorubrum sp. B1-46]UGB25387.1 DUF6481 family protein [Methylorubrum sp. B1-46]HEV2543944.1 DUF6481 family protein [Methylobacterium sp.]
MSFSKQNSFDDRRQDSASAREAMLARFRARPSQDDPAVVARGAERRAIAAAREERVQERELQRRLEAERLAAIAAAEREAEAARKAAEIEAAAERARLAQAKQKEERDARYAARKAKIKLRR